MAETTIAASIAHGLIAFAASKGADAAALIARAGIDPAAFDAEDGRVPVAQYVTLMRAAQAMTGDPALALHWGEMVDMAEVSIVGLIMNASETMMDAFAQMGRYHRLVIDGAAVEPPFRLVYEGGAMWMVATASDTRAFPEQIESGFARLTCGPRRFLPHPHVLEVNVMHPAPAYRDEYARIFQCPVVFEARWNAMRMEASLATHRVALLPRYAFGVLIAHADAMLAELERAKSVRGQVEGLLLPLLHTGDIGMEAIAARMGMSRQTLLRRLKAEGATFETVLDDLRHRMAVEYLGGQKVSVNETAYLVGFSDPASFSRAFKRWTGASPRTVRGAKT